MVQPLDDKAKAKIQARLEHCLGKTDLKVGKKITGKVRDTYVLSDKVVLVTTDRQSAFDRQLALVPYKGQVLNKVAAWWFAKTAHIIPNHVIAVPHPNVTVGKKCTIFPVEVVVRGYMTGSTSTSVWTHYSKGSREYCGVTLTEGMKKSQAFATPILTPTTKAEDHDAPISPKEIVAQKLMTQAEWDYVSAKALELFVFGQKVAKEVRRREPTRPLPVQPALASRAVAHPHLCAPSPRPRSLAARSTACCSSTRSTSSAGTRMARS
jgi:phosphoribosylaminoimidazole-succinocarboxamide synthase